MPAITVEQAFQIATAQLQMGQLGAAEAMYRKIVEVQPGHTEAWLQLVNVYERLGRPAEATACRQRATPGQSLSDCVHLGNTLMDRGRLPEAIAAFEQALQIAPDRPEVHYNLGNVHVKAGNKDKAIACYLRALALRPDYPKARSNLGRTWLDQERPAEALAQFQLMAESAQRSYNIGVALSRIGRTEDAIASYRQALTFQQDYADAYYGLSAALLRLGRFEEGWRVYARYQEFQQENVPRWKFLAPLWDGTPLNGQTLLLYEGQGHGDVLQFLRYLPAVHERAGDGRFILACPQSLIRLLRYNDRLGIELLDREQPTPLLPHFDLQTSFFECPLALQRWEPMPVTGPYLQAIPTDRAIWRERLGTSNRLRVGLVWAGNPHHPSDPRRSMPPDKLLPLLGLPDAAFYSLQVKPAGGQPAALLQAGLIDLTESIRDFADTAALLSELDLVISVDTAVAHLAGALGRPVWTLHSFVAEWRWGCQGEETPWYPTMRLFRQPAPGDWDAVIHHVFEELGTLATHRNSIA